MRIQTHALALLTICLLLAPHKQIVQAQELSSNPWTILPSFDPSKSWLLLPGEGQGLFWRPSVEQVEKIEKKLVNISAPSDEPPDKLSRRLYELSRRLYRYYRQYSGTEIEGKKYVRVDGFHRELFNEDEDLKRYWKTSLVGGFDGCETWWHLMYDVEADRFLKLTLNGTCREFSPFDEEKPCSLEAVSDFVAESNETNFKRLTGRGSSSVFYVQYDCLEALGKVKEGWPHIVKTASEGNEWAVKFLLSNLNQLEGDDLKDVLRALGASIDNNPNLVMRLFQYGMLKEHFFKSCLSMTLLDSTAHKKEILLNLERRKEKISSLRDEDVFWNVRRVALTYLNDAIRDIQTK